MTVKQVSSERSQRWLSLRASLICLLSLVWAVSAQAAVEIRFHSKEFGATFPHAFIALAGTVESTGERVDANYGFTVRHLIGPSILFGPVQGEVISENAAYVAGSTHHFTLVLTDEEYQQVMELVERWRTLPQPSYRLGRRNCVSFVAEIATSLGLTADASRFMRRPRAFLERVRETNSTLIASRGPTSIASALR